MRPLALGLGLALTACAARYAPPPRCPVAPAQGAPEGPALDDSELVPTADAPSIGPRDAPVTVVVFSDFQCPYCARGRQVMNDLRLMYPRDVRVVWRNLPLARRADAPAAAEAAMEAWAQGGDAAFWRLHDLLFAHQDHLSRADLERYAGLAGLDTTRLRRALDEGTHVDRVARDAALAERLGVDGTPAFFVNGTPIFGAMPLSTFEGLTDALLELARARNRPRSFYADTVRAPLPPPDRQNAASAWATVHELPAPPDAPSRGPASAPVVMQVFSDFQCPYCARVEPTLAALRAHYGERLRVVWRDFPLPNHRDAMPAAEAGREVRAQLGDEGFWRYHDALFAWRSESNDLSRDAIERVAVSVGADARALRAALDDHRHEARVRADMTAAQATGVRFGTPAFFINGHFVSGARPLAEFRARIDSLAAQSP